MDRNELRKRLSRWPAGTPVILEGSFGWGWISDELKSARADPHLVSSRKVAAWRDARGLAKSNKIDADLLGELWDQKPELRNGQFNRWCWATSKPCVRRDGRR